MNYSDFTKQYSLSKTLRFRLIPEGDTLKYIEEKEILQKDKERADEYKTAKDIIDRYHKQFIEHVLNPESDSDAPLSAKEINEYFELYRDRKNREKEFLKMQDVLRKEISKKFTKDKKEEYDLLFDLDELAKKTGEKAIVAFKNFYTYFSGFNQARKNMYSEEAQTTGIANRIVNENLPKFFDNVIIGEKVLSELPSQIVEEINAAFKGKFDADITVQEILSVSYAGKVFSQRQIEKYNGIIGGYTTNNAPKIQGLNEKINNFNQKQKTRVPQLKMLFKQILSERESYSDIPEEFDSDDDVIESIKKRFEDSRNVRGKIIDLLRDFNNPNGVFIHRKAIGTLSEKVYGNWEIIQNGLDEKSRKKKYYSLEELRQAGERGFKDFYSSEELQQAEENGSKGQAVQTTPKEFIDKEIQRLSDEVDDAFNLFDRSIVVPYQGKLHSKKNNKDVQTIKALTDALKEFQSFAKLLYDGHDEETADPAFYGEFVNAYEEIQPIIKLYNKVRNYISKKPYSLEKYKLNFNRSDFLGGWAQPNEYNASEAHLFEKDGQYYILITNNSWKSADIDRLKHPKSNRMRAVHWNYYFQKPDNKNTPRLFIRSKGNSYAPAVQQYNLPIEDVIEAYDNGWFKTEYAKKDPEKFKRSLEKIIDYFKLGFSRHESYSCFVFNWKPTSEYQTIAEFYQDAISSCYRVEQEVIDYEELLKMVAEGRGCLFRLYNKDFSEYSKGTPNLHTLYFKMLFDPLNQAEGIFKLCGGAEMFYRPASLKLSETTVHPANKPLENKNEMNPRRTSTFAYDLIKDKRFIEPQFELHLPITLNYRESDITPSMLNAAVCDSIAKSKNQNIIGIDRGERNLIYVSVIESSGKIVEQYSLNEIVNEYKNVQYRTDYRKLLDRREKERLEARREWTTIQSIKELKEGYISQVVHKICELAVKYQAIIVMENLNKGFKNIRSAIEKSVYQKFEKMLTDKLSYLVADKNHPATEPGGILNAYQLAKPAVSYEEMRGQNGIIFYVDAWDTSKIDPTTGFVDLLHPKYENLKEARSLFEKFDDISFDEDADCFTFTRDYSYDKKDSKSKKKEEHYQSRRAVCTYGERIESFRNKDKNSQWDYRRVCLTTEFKKLFEKNKIDYRGNLKDAILRKIEDGDVKFCKELIRLLKLTLQMRNSVPNSTKPEEDYMISPVRNQSGEFYDSRKKIPSLPTDADANGAFNIARKGLILIEKIRTATENGKKADLSVGRAEWLKYADEHPAK